MPGRCWGPTRHPRNGGANCRSGWLLRSWCKIPPLLVLFSLQCTLFHPLFFFSKHSRQLNDLFSFLFSLFHFKIFICLILETCRGTSFLFFVFLRSISNTPVTTVCGRPIQEAKKAFNWCWTTAATTCVAMVHPDKSRKLSYAPPPVPPDR